MLSWSGCFGIKKHNSFGHGNVTENSQATEHGANIYIQIIFRIPCISF